MGASVSAILIDAGLGYTLASGRLFCEFSDFQLWCERLLDRPILTHEFADEVVWDELRQAFESQITSAIAPSPPAEGEPAEGEAGR